MNFKLWLKLLTQSQHFTKQEWNKLDAFSKWLAAVRASFLTMTYFSAIITGLLAYRSGDFDWWLWLLLFIGILFAHVTCNLLNDYFDHLGKRDPKDGFRLSYGVHPLAMGYVSKSRFFYKYIGLNGLLALLVGLTIIYMVGGGWFIWLLFIGGGLLVMAYPWPLKEYGLSEVGVALAWGPFMIGGGYYVLSGQFTTEIFLAGLAYSFCVAGIVLGAHLDKYDEYKKRKEKTLPLIIGENNALKLALGMQILPYLLLACLVLNGFYLWSMAVVLLSIPLLLKNAKIYLQPRAKSAAQTAEPIFKKTWPNYYTIVAARFDRVFGALYILAILVDVLVRKWF